MPGPRIPELDKSICGCSLKLASKIIAAIFFAFCSFVFIVSFGTIFWQEYEDHKLVSKERIYRQALLVECALMAIVSGLMATLSAFMYYGVEKHKESYILPWCILTTAFNAIYLFFILTTFYVRFVSIYQFISLLIVASVAYAVLVVYSHFREMRRQKNSPTVFTNAE